MTLGKLAQPFNKLNRQSETLILFGKCYIHIVIFYTANIMYLYYNNKHSLKIVAEQCLIWIHRFLVPHECHVYRRHFVSHHPPILLPIDTVRPLSVTFYSQKSQNVHFFRLINLPFLRFLLTLQPALTEGVCSAQNPSRGINVHFITYEAITS